MINFNFDLKKITRIFQLFDTSLGIDIEDTHLKVVKTKKFLSKYRIVTQIKITWKEQAVDDNSIRKLSEIISERKLNSTYINLLTPLDSCLLKKVKIPKLQLGDIKNFLYQNSDLYLEWNLSNKELKMNYILLSESSDSRELLVILKRSPISDKPLINNSKPHFYFSFNYRSIILNNIKLLFLPTFTGRIIDFLKNSIYSFRYVKGTVADLQQFFPEDMTEVKNKLETKDKNRRYIISGNEKYTKQFNMPKSNSSFRCIKSVYPEYLNAFAASLSPFVEISPHSSLLSPQEEQIIEQLYFKKISLKTLYFLGAIVLGFIALSLLIQMGITIYHDRQREYYDKIKPIISQNQLLNSENTLLEAKLKKFNQINSRHAPLAYFIYKIVSVIPTDLWLSDVSINSNLEGGMEFLIFGYAPEERDIHYFLRNLEDLSFCREISLDHLAAADSREINQKRNKRNNQFYMFKVSLHA